MELVVFFSLTWLVISFFFVIKKRLDIFENTFVFLITLIVNINFSWIVIDEMELLTVTQKVLPYTAYLLNRSIITPLLILVHLNFFIEAKTFVEKGLIITSSLILLLCLSVTIEVLNITEKINWNYSYSAIYYLLLFIIAIISYEIFYKLTKNAVR